MGRYYNKLRSPLSATLRDGSTAFFAPKTWVTLAKEVEGSAAVMELRRKGFLAYKPEKAAKPAVAPEPAKEETPSPKAPEPPKPTPEPAPEPVVEAAAVEPVIPVETVEEPVHVDTTISWGETSSDDDRTSLNTEVDEESVASDGSTDTESKRSKRRKRK